MLTTAALRAGAHQPGPSEPRQADDTSPLLSRREWIALAWGTFTAAAAVALAATGRFLFPNVLTLKEVALRQNWGQALDLSSSFFDAVRVEATGVPDSGLRDGLNEVLAMRDRVTAALAKADPTVGETLHEIELRLRRLLGYALPPESAAALGKGQAP